jgi:hypothetical protein
MATQMGRRAIPLDLPVQGKTQVSGEPKAC